MTIGLLQRVYGGGVMSMLVAFLVMGLAITSFNEPLLKTDRSPEGLRTVIEAVVPPRDLYDSLGEIGIDISRRGTWSLSFVNKYVGPHVMGLHLGNRSDDLYWSDTPIKLRVVINFYEADKLILSRSLETKPSIFSGRKGSGIALVTYECPADLPRAVPITAKVVVVEPDPELQAEWGPIKLYAARRARH